MKQLAVQWNLIFGVLWNHLQNKRGTYQLSSKCFLEKVISEKQCPAHESCTYQPRPGGRCGWWTRTGSPLCTCSCPCPTAPRSPWWGSSAGYGPGGCNQTRWDLLKQSFTLLPSKRTGPWIINWCNPQLEASSVLVWQFWMLKWFMLDPGQHGCRVKAFTASAENLPGPCSKHIWCQCTLSPPRLSRMAPISRKTTGLYLSIHSKVNAHPQGIPHLSPNSHLVITTHQQDRMDMIP